MKPQRQKEEKAILTFLKQTKKGKYAKIDKKQLSHLRIKEQTEETYDDDEYFYGWV